MPTSKMGWKEFEMLIAQIQGQVAPYAVVHHNEVVIGQSGRRRQLDITVSQKIGFQSIFIVVECKRYKRSVGISTVEAFAAKLVDVRASEGIMVSIQGFDEGAKAIARQHHISLLSYREARDVDWQKLIGPSAWLKLVVTDMHHVRAIVRFTDGSEAEVPLESPLFSTNGESLFTIQKIMESEIPANVHDVGEFIVVFEVIEPLHLQVNSVFREVENIFFVGVYRAREYVVNLNFAGGHIIEDASNEEVVYKSVVTEGFNWQEVLASPNFRELSEEDYRMVGTSPGSMTVKLDLQQLQPYLRLEFTKK